MDRPRIETDQIASWPRSLGRRSRCDRKQWSICALADAHGAGGNPQQVLSWFGKAAETGLVLLVPHSVGRTWDLVIDDFGEDVANLDCALAAVISHLPIDPLRFAIGGFSDGASYALSLGIRNGALIRNVIALSPGFICRSPAIYKPSIFISHGRQDTVLPIEQCGRAIASRLKMEGYRVDYREFDGGHIIREPILKAALATLLS